MLKDISKINSVYVFIDASNVWNIVKSERKFIEFKNLKKHFKEKFGVSEVKIFYYDAYPKDGTRDYSLEGKHKFFTYLKKALDFVVRKKELKRISEICAEGAIILEKGNMDVELTIDAVHHKEKYDVAVLLSGDADFIALVRYLKNDGKKVFVYSSRGSISHEMKTGGDGYTDIREVSEIWGRELKYRGSDGKNKVALN
jgi:uncharacterized LabA/DUF88 family protein